MVDLMPKIEVENLSLTYGDTPALSGVSFDSPATGLVVITGPPGSGKSTLLRALNRMNDPIPNHRRGGSVLIDGVDVYSPETDPMELRRRVGMVFANSKGFDRSLNDEFHKRLLHWNLKKPADRVARISTAFNEIGWSDDIESRLAMNPGDLTPIDSMKRAVALTMINDPEVLLFDEPFGCLNENDADELLPIVEMLRRKYLVVIAYENAAHWKNPDCLVVLDGGRVKEFSANAGG